MQFSLILSRLRNTMIFQTESYTRVLMQASASASTTDPAPSLCFLLGLLHHIKASVYSAILAASMAFCKHFAGDRLPVKWKQVWCSDLHTLTKAERLESYFFPFLSFFFLDFEVSEVKPRVCACYTSALTVTHILSYSWLSWATRRIHTLWKVSLKQECGSREVYSPKWRA